MVGAGRIGGRHAEAMARVTTAVDLDIVDPQPQARRRAVLLLEEAGGLHEGSVREFSCLNDLKAAPDLAIIATSSRERPDAIRAVVALGARSLILEKVLFTRLADYDAIDGLLADTGITAWVNCGNNSLPGFGRLKELVGDLQFDYRIEGTGWGLGCNLIHYLDEFTSLSSQREIRLNATELEPTVIEAKRPGYVEFFGRVSGNTTTPTTFTAICRNGSGSGWTVTIDLGDRRVLLSPSQTLTIKDSCGARTERYPIPLQSEMTASYVNAIFNGESPRLPDYPSASRLHRTMLAAFLEHLRRVRGDDTIDECPVT